jgi:tetratricopeptide (TPR) repeat protein
MRLKGGWPFTKQLGPNLVLAQYEPTSKIESVATNVLISGKFTLEQGHIELGKYYESTGEREKAFEEYNALMYTVPYFDLFYQLAAKALVEMKKYDKAREVLEESLKYQETAFAYQWIGQIYLIKNETDKGIEFLERARAVGVQDDAVLYNLARAYFNTGRWEQGDDILNRLRTTGTADHSLISLLEEQRESSDTLASRKTVGLRHN